MLAPDVTESILVALLQIFTQQLQTIIPPTDRLYLKVLKQSPLQDDPTIVAPFLTIEDDPDKKPRRLNEQECREYGDAEIGGPLRFLAFFRAQCGTPLAITRDQARQDINRLTSRIMTVLASYYALAGITGVGLLASQDMSEVVEGANQYLIDDMEKEVYGGESTWYGKAEIWWHYPVSWSVPPMIRL